ncbi:hypothetical protein [Novosphingobium sediminicola]|uniref:C-type lysozyme inhibitor domain-containing protein n=1 Tax=Novosphingobium sediminicola TaxID=563162 RepID=A0A7W6G6C3_9SPHN|nr:hypothetical protein [Novosphingobium sediminicola]MBB3955151.1 hypothetical protein [Novosphingobium sediminicola]
MLRTSLACLVTLAALATGAQEAHAQARRQIFVQNACSRPLRVLLDYTDHKGLHDQGWYYFNPRESSYLRSPAGDKLTQIEDIPLYAYAETTDTGRKLHWQGNGPEMKRDGGIYRSMPLTTKVDGDGDILARITCD